MSDNMLKVRRTTNSRLHAAVIGAEVVFHSIVRSIRSKHENAFMAFFTAMLQAIVFIAVMFIMFGLLGLRGAAVRGDFLLYVMSGIFLYMTHVQSVGAVAGASGSSSPLHQHAPLNSIVSIISAALSVLYLQLLVALLIIGGYHIAWTPVYILDPIGVLSMFLLAWFTGCAVGLCFMALKPWAPTLVNIFKTFYTRANMIASGKMFLANTLPGFMLAMFDWNPLFHSIDQARGHMFLNYYPRNSSWEYAFWVGLTLTALGLLGMFFSDRSKSINWGASS